MQTSRYDTHADWFVAYTQDWQSTSASFLPVDLTNQHVLDLASGWGQLSRELAARGASITAVELANPLVQRARALKLDTPLGIRYLQGDAGILDWWNGQAFDGVVCNMALMDIDDLDAALHTAYAVLRPAAGSTSRCCTPAFPVTQKPARYPVGRQRRAMPPRDG